VALTLTALDTAYDAPGADTIAGVLRSLDGGRISLATLGRSETDYVQAHGSVAAGFTLEYQQGSVATRHRSRESASLEQAARVFQRYADGDPAWREGIQWETERVEVPRTGWTGTWIGFAALVLGIAVLVWLWRGW
jgi:hypothetical protein